MILSTAAGLFGPYERYELFPDRIRTWPAGAAHGAAGADIPLAVVGPIEIIDIDAPPGFSADTFTWTGNALVSGELPGAGDPAVPAAE